MGLDMWFQQDVARILAAQEEVTRELEENGANAKYIKGRRGLLNALRVEFGLIPAVRPRYEIRVSDFSPGDVKLIE